MGDHHRCVPSNPVSSPASHRRIPMKESTNNHENVRSIHQANLKVHSQPSPKKEMPYGNNRAQVSKDLVSQPAPISTEPMFYMSHGSLSTVLGTALQKCTIWKASALPNLKKTFRHYFLLVCFNLRLYLQARPQRNVCIWSTLEYCFWRGYGSTKRGRNHLLVP